MNELHKDIRYKDMKHMESDNEGVIMINPRNMALNTVMAISIETLFSNVGNVDEGKRVLVKIAKNHPVLWLQYAAKIGYKLREDSFGHGNENYAEVNSTLHKCLTQMPCVVLGALLPHQNAMEGFWMHLSMTLFSHITEPLKEAIELSNGQRKEVIIEQSVLDGNAIISNLKPYLRSTCFGYHMDEQEDEGI